MIREELSLKTQPPAEPTDGLGKEIAALAHGDHLCMVYENNEEQLRGVVPFIHHGLTAGDRCVYVADDQSVEEVVRALESAGVDTRTEMDRGALLVMTKRETYLRGGVFDPQEMIEFLDQSVQEALDEGFNGYRAAGEMTWAIGTDVIETQRLVEYEALLNRFYPSNRAVGLCQYNRDRFPPEAIYDVLRTHPTAVLGDQVCPNLYYEPPELVLRGGDTADRVDWMIHQLRRWHRMSVSREELQREVDERKKVQSDLEHTAAALETSNQELRQFAHIVSHDLREPLRTVSGYIHLLGSRYSEALDEQARRYIDRTLAGTQRMDRMIHDLLEYARVQTRAAQMETVDLNSVMGDALDDLERMIHERDAQVQVGALPRVVADRSQMHQIFTNLITNAIKYCPPDRIPLVRVTASTHDDAWQVNVQDNGSGIPQDQHERIFVPSQRLVSRTGEDTGTGMGLAIAQRIVERHGGRIWLESTPGEGTTFHFTIPQRTH